MRLSENEYARMPERLQALFVKLPNPGKSEVLEAFGKFGESKSNLRSDYDNNRDASVYGEFASSPSGPSNTYSDAGSPARFYFCAKASAADRCGSSHPTVKPVALMRWLCRLITPPGGTILDPFAGSGATIQAAMLEGFSAIGIEREAEYHADCLRRLAHMHGGDAPLFAEVAA